MFDRKSAAYQQFIADIAEAVLSKIDARGVEPELSLPAPTGPLPTSKLASLPQLTPREVTVLRGLVAGGTNKSIAMDLKISPRTVEVHRASIMEKLGTPTIAALIALALQSGVMPTTAAETKRPAAALGRAGQ